MIEGHVRDNFPYVTVALPAGGQDFNVEFLIDTGFDGRLALPSKVLNKIDAAYLDDDIIRTADGRHVSRPIFEVEITWLGEPQAVYVIQLDSGVPLLGVELLADNFVTMNMTDGGQVSIGA
jgi:clan AA aspartic protease